MSDELDKVVRGLEAERYRRSMWWTHMDLGPSTDIAAQLDRIRDLAASTGPTISTPQGAELLTSINDVAEASIHRHVHRAPTGRYAQQSDVSTPPATARVDDALGGSDLLKDNDASNQQETQ